MSIAPPDLAAPSAPAASPSPSPRAAGRGVGLWGRVVLACLVLAAAGGLRSWQGRQIAATLDRAKGSPFPLEELPLTLGDWDGRVHEFDPHIARATGSTDIVLRNYVNRKTGASVDLIVLYGPAVDVWVHTPEQCYPAAGYDLDEDPSDYEVKTAVGRSRFRSLVYKKDQGGSTERQEVYYAWLFGGRWTPDLDSAKRIERTPSLYKIQLARLLADRELRDGAPAPDGSLDQSNPCRALLQELLPEIERRRAAASAAATATAAAPPTGRAS